MLGECMRPATDFPRMHATFLISPKGMNRKTAEPGIEPQKCPAAYFYILRFLVLRFNAGLP